MFPITPCAEACFFGSVSVESSDSDGVEVEVHVLDPPRRTLLFRGRVPPGNVEVPIELSLAPWAGRGVLLRLGTTFGEEFGSDYAKFIRPRIEPCSARRGLAGNVRVSRGSARASGDDIVIGRAGAVLRMPITAVEGTCFTMAVRTRDEQPVIVAVRAAEGGVEHVLYETGLPPGRNEISDISFFDFAGRPIELVIDVRPTDPSPARVRLVWPRLRACER